MQLSLFDEMESGNETEHECLTIENDAMRDFFDKLAIPVIRKTVRKVATQLRRFPRAACQFGDDSTLNFFEEVCVMMQESSMDDYIFVEDTIERCCEDAFDDLKSDEKLIINHTSNSSHQNGFEINKDEFLSYAIDYNNKKIEDAFDRRGCTD